MKTIPPYLSALMVRDMMEAITDARPTSTSRELFRLKLNAWFFVVKGLEPGEERDKLKDWLVDCSIRFAAAADSFAQREAERFTFRKFVSVLRSAVVRSYRQRLQIEES